MRVHSVALDGFRNLDTAIVFAAPLAVVVGANNAGKSNVIDALRTVLWPADGPGARRWITVEDFAHDATGRRLRDDFSIEIVFGDLSSTDEAHLVTCLAPALGQGFARLRLKANVGSNGKIHSALSGGDAYSDIDQFAREAVHFSYLPPLRDAVRELRPGSANRVAHLLRARVPEGHADRGEMERIVREANDSLDGVDSMVQAETAIDEHLHAMSSPTFAQPSDLRFAPAQFDAIIRQLSAHAGDIVARNVDSGVLANAVGAPLAPAPLRSLGTERFDLLRSQAGLQVKSRTSGLPERKLLEPLRLAGLAMLPEPSPGDIFFGRGRRRRGRPRGHASSATLRSASSALCSVDIASS